VKFQRTMPRFTLPVASAHVMGDQPAFDLRTSAADEAVNYALTLPGPVAATGGEIDVLVDLTGVQAQWQSSDGQTTWNGWLPHLDLTAARGFTAASTEHQQAFQLTKRKGTLTVSGQLDLWCLLHPAVQPESKLDYEYPPERVTVVLKADSKLGLKLGTNLVNTGEREARITIQPKENHWLPLEVALETGGADPRLDVSWFTAKDPRPRPLPLRRVLLPWAKPYLAVAMAKSTPEIAGGNWLNGKRLFFGDQATCYKCHTIRGEGGNIGADLSNLIYRDYASVLRDITEPSTAINPEHIAYSVQLQDGEVETGVLLSNNDREIVLGQVNGKNLSLPKAKVANMKASAISLMPEGLLKNLTEQQQRDLLTFMLTIQ